MAVIEIKNPEDGSIGETTEEAFDAVWKEKGWTKVSSSSRSSSSNTDTGKGK